MFQFYEMIKYDCSLGRVHYAQISDLFKEGKGPECEKYLFSHIVIG